MYGWCDAFQSNIIASRTDEIAAIQTKACLVGLFTSIFNWYPKLLAIVLFLIVNALNLDKGISLGKVFGSAYIFKEISGPLTWFPTFIGIVIDGFISGKRLQNFLRCEEVPRIYDESNSNVEGDNAVEINGCDFTLENFQQEEKAVPVKRKTIDSPTYIRSITEFDSDICSDKKSKETIK
jgi:ABC-type multidrug transport system fused ATPase/permease subunit